MARKLCILVLGAVLAVSLVSAPAQAQNPRGDVYSEGPVDDRYRYTDDSCKGLPFKVKGRIRGYETVYNVPGSDGQAYLGDFRHRYREVWTNPANGRKAFASAKRARIRELRAEHIKGDVWAFITLISGAPLILENDRGRVVLTEWGRIKLRIVYDTLGDGKPGAEFIRLSVISKRGNWPTFEKDFNFCKVVHRVLD